MECEWKGETVIVSRIEGLTACAIGDHDSRVCD